MASPNKIKTDIKLQLANMSRCVYSRLATGKSKYFAIAVGRSVCCQSPVMRMCKRTSFICVLI